MKKKMYQRPDGLFEKAMVIDGKKVHFYGKTEREVFLKISEYKKVSRNGKTVTELADDWLGTIEKEISPSTYEGYKATCNKIINYFGKTYARTLTEKDIEKFVDALPELTRGGRISKKTAINTLAILNQIFRFGIKNGHLELNPRQNIHVPKNLSKNPREAITEKQIGIITEQGKAHPEDTAALIAIFALYTGLRRGELICLQRSDIDFKNRLINVTKSVFFDSNKPKLKDPKTAAGYRVVALPDFLADLIPKREGFLFSLDDGKSMLLKSQLNDIWIKYQIDNGLVGVGLHNLRHTYASLLYDAGIDVKMAQSLLGHADISTTQNIYTHILKKKQERDFAALNSYFDQLNRVDDM